MTATGAGRDRPQSRVHEVRRPAVPRIDETMVSAGLPIRGNVAREGRERVNEQPEYDDLVVVAEATGAPLKSCSHEPSRP